MWFIPIGSKFAAMMQAKPKLYTFGLGQGMRKAEKTEGEKMGRLEDERQWEV
jgi:hypothetical protein